MRRVRLRRRGIVTIVLAVLAIGIGFAFASHAGRQVTGSIAAKIALGDKPINILLVANNARGVAAGDPLGLGTAAGQADVVLLAHLDPATHTIDAITVPRDALTAQPDWHNPIPKIKTLLFMGDQDTPPDGPKYLTQAVEKLTGLPIDGYVVANFAGFKAAVDAVGGLTVDVKARVYDPVNSGADFAPGVQHMNGAQALAFVRVRQNQAGNGYRINDFQRMQAEVQVLGLLRDKLLNPAHAATLIPTFVKRMKHDVATNLSQDRLVRIGIAMAGAPVYQVPIATLAASMTLAPATIPGINAAGHIEGADYDVLDPREIYAKLAAFGSQGSDDGLPPLPEPSTISVALYGTPHMALHLQHLGFTHVHVVGGATGEGRVVYPAAKPEAGWQVARAIGTGGMYVVPGDVQRVTVFQ